jgi:NADH dehydrogenase
MAEKLHRAVVLGGTGFLGRRVVATLGEAGWAAVAASRHPAAGQVVAADVTEASSVARAVADAELVVNCVALYAENAGLSFHDVHVEGARRVAEAAGRAGAKWLVHFSGIGADETSPSRYVRARGEGEMAVRQAFPAATILRPSVMFGPDDSFLNSLARIAAVLPVIPLFGKGDTRLQPVFVEDVAGAVVRCTADAAHQGKVFELGGPDVVTYRELVRRVAGWTGRPRLLLPFPWAGWDLLARVGTLLSRPPVSEGQVALMRHNNVARRHMPGFADLGLTPRSMNDLAPAWLA